MKNLFQQRLEEKGFLVVSHRGFWGGNVIENSIESMQLAYKAGADIVECDVCRTVDGDYYVFHDGAEPKLYGVQKRFFDWTTEEVEHTHLKNTLSVDSGKTAVPLQAYLDAVPAGHLINVDRSWVHWEQGLLEILTASGLSQQMLLKAPTVDTYLKILDAFADPIPFMPILSTWEELDLLDKYPHLNIVGVEIIADTTEDPGYDPHFIERIHDHGWFTFANAEVLSGSRKLFGGHDDDLAVRQGWDASWGVLVDMGIDAIQTDWPNFLAQYREERFPSKVSLRQALDPNAPLDREKAPIVNITTGRDLEHLVPIYGSSYVADPALQEIARTLSTWQFADALGLIHARLEVEPEDIEVRLLTMEVLAILDYYERAYAIAQDVLRIDPAHVQALSFAATLSHILAKVEEEQRHLENLHRVSPAAFDETMENFANVAASQSPYYPNPPIGDDAPQAITIFGQRLHPDGSMPAELVERVDVALVLLKEFPNAIAIPSGSTVHTDFAEADSIAMYLRENGIAEERIVRETRARDTVGNAIGVKEILEERGLTQVCVATSWTHVRRAAMTLELLSLSENGDLFVTGIGSGDQGDAIQPLREKAQSYISFARASHLFTKDDFRRFETATGK